MPVFTDVQFAKHLREEPLSPCYFLYGKEAFLAESMLQKLIEKAVPKGMEAFSYRNFDGAETDFNALRTEVEALPMMTAQKCVLLRNPNLEKMAKDDLEALTELLSNPNPTTVFILFVTAYELHPEKSAKLKKLYAAVLKSGVAVCFEPKTGAELQKLIKQRVSKAGCTISPPAIRALTERCGTSLETLSTEIDKLTAYRLTGEITKQDVENVTGLNLEVSVFELSKALLRDDFNRAFLILNDLFACRTEPIAILAVLHMTFIDLYRAKAAMLSDRTVADVCAAFPYARKEFRVRQAFGAVPRYSMKLLRFCLRTLAEADVRLKTSSADGQIVLETALAEILNAVRSERG